MKRLLSVLICLFALSGCGAVTVDEEEAPTRETGEIVVEAYYDDGAGDPVLIGGLSCTLDQREGGSLSVREETEPARPLVFTDLQPGSYEVTLHGAERTFTTRPLGLEAGRRLTVHVDVLVAKDLADRRQGVAFLGEGLVHLLTAPFHLKAKVIDPEGGTQEGFPLVEDPSGGE